MSGPEDQTDWTEGNLGLDKMTKEQKELPEFYDRLTDEGGLKHELEEKLKDIMERRERVNEQRREERAQGIPTKRPQPVYGEQRDVTVKNFSQNYARLLERQGIRLKNKVTEEQIGEKKLEPGKLNVVREFIGKKPKVTYVKGEPVLATPKNSWAFKTEVLYQTDITQKANRGRLDPKILTDGAKAVVRDQLTKEMEELRKEFDKFGAKPKGGKAK